MSYSDLDAKLRTKAGKPADSRKLANNTYGVRKENGDIAVRLHATDVVTWHPDETVTLNTGGWYTVTTKGRINDWADPFSVYSVGGTWHVSVRNPEFDPEGDREAQRGIPYHLTVGAFYDGITLDAKDPTAVLVEPAEVQAA